MSHTRNDDKLVSQTKDLPWWMSVTSSSFGGAIGAMVAYPFEGLKKSVQSNLITNWKQAVGLFFHPKELYRGTSAFATSLVPTTIIQMSAKRFISHLAISDNDRALGDIFCGALGALASAPAEKLILTQRKYQIGPMEALAKVVKLQGVLAPWDAIKPLACREAVFGVCMLKYGKLAYDEYGFMGTIGVGFAGAIISHPFDCIATKMQLMSFMNADQGIKEKVTTWDVVKKITAEQGMKGFTKGLTWRLGLFTSCMAVIPLAEGAISDQLNKVNYMALKGK